MTNTGQLIIKTIHGDAQVEPLHILPSGRLAVHFTLTENGLDIHCLTITHVPTGFSVLHTRRTWAQAIRMAERLDKLAWPTEPMSINTRGALMAILDPINKALRSWKLKANLADEEGFRAKLAEPNQ